MKKILMVAVASLAVIAMTAVYAGAGSISSTGIVVQATMVKNCLESQPGTLQSFANIDTSSNTQVTANALTDEVIKCTNGAAFTVTATSGNNAANTGSCNGTGVSMQMKSTTVTAPTDVIPYTFICSNGSSYTGKGFGGTSGLSLGIQATLIPSQAANATYANDYKDTVTLTINY